MTRALPLLRIWALMLALTGAAMLIGHVHGAERLRAWEAGLLLGLSFIKASLLLRHYLEVDRASPWHGGLMMMIGLLLLVIFALALLG